MLNKFISDDVGGDSGCLCGVNPLKTWSAGGNLNTTMYDLAGCGTQDAGLSFGGFGPLAVTEEYNQTCPI